MAPPQVFEEVRRPEFLREWCVDNRAMFLSRGMLGTWRAGSRKNSRNWSSPTRPDRRPTRLVAPAVALKGSLSGNEPPIITHEDPHKLNKIPSVAKSFGVESDRMTGIFDREGWKF